MMKKEFNMSADDNKAGSAGGSPKKRGRIIDYADIEEKFADNPEAGRALKDKMDSLMEAIDRNPASFETIIDFGVEPIKTLGKLAKDTMTVQTKMTDQVRVMNIVMDGVAKSAAESALGDLMEGLKSAGSGAAGVGAAGLKGLGGLLKKFGQLVSGSKKKKTEEERHVQEMIDKLPEMYYEMQAMLMNLKGSEPAIQSVMKETERLGVARVALVREMDVYLGAVPEVLRRYEEIYIANARAEYEESQDPEDEVYLIALIKGKDNFIGQYNQLEGSRALAVDAAQRLRTLLDQMETQRKIIIQFRTFRENEWIGLMADAGLQGSSLKIAQMIKQADEMGNKLHDHATVMIDVAAEMTLNSQSHGTVDTKRLLESLIRRRGMIEKENQVREQRAIDAESARRQVRAETENLLDSVEKNLKGRILEAAPDKKEDTSKTIDVSNDNDTPSPAVPKKAVGGPGPA